MAFCTLFIGDPGQDIICSNYVLNDGVVPFICSFMVKNSLYKNVFPCMFNSMNSCTISYMMLHSDSLHIYANTNVIYVSVLQFHKKIFLINGFRT